MDDDDRLLVQMSVNLSIALIAASFTLFAAIVAAFAAFSSRFSTRYIAVVGAVAFIACIFLIASIFLGGKGITTTNKTVRQHPNPLPQHYDENYFNWQAGMGLVGFLVVLALLGIGLAGSTSAAREQSTITITLQNIRGELQRIWEEIGRIRDVQGKLIPDSTKKPEDPSSEKRLQNVQGELQRVWEEISRIRDAQGKPISAPAKKPRKKNQNKTPYHN